MQINNKKTKTNSDFKKKYKFANQSGKIWPIATTKKNAKKNLFSICQSQILNKKNYYKICHIILLQNQYQKDTQIK